MCSGDPQRPCYKIAYFQDVWSRVAFKEASEACEMDGGSLLSIQTAGEQTDVENLLQVRASRLPSPAFLPVTVPVCRSCRLEQRGASLMGISGSG